MSKLSLSALRPRSVAATAWLALGAATPAMAESLEFRWPEFEWPPSPPDLLLIGSGVVLVLALAFSFMRRPTRMPRTPDGPDLRWWKNSPR